jgi:hypothetical protein
VLKDHSIPSFGYEFTEQLKRMKPSAAATINMGLVHDNSDGFHGQ